MSKHLAKVGRVISIRLYVARIRKPWGLVERPRVMVTGTKGKARFGGFLWGYMGEGPRGLVDLLVAAFGCPKIVAEKIVENQPNDYDSTHGKRIRTIALIEACNG